MGDQTTLVRELAKQKGWGLRIFEADKWKLWMRKPVRCDWLVVGAHGGSEHRANIHVPELHPTKIYFLTQMGATAPGNPNSWYVGKAANGKRWSQTTVSPVKVAGGEERDVRSTIGGEVEVFNTAEGELPFEYRLTRYSEDAHVKTVTDMYEGGAEREFDLITLSKSGASFSEILTWLSKNNKFHYPHIVAGFCNSHMSGIIRTPYATVEAENFAQLKEAFHRPPRKAVPQAPQAAAHIRKPQPPQAENTKPLPIPPPKLGGKPLPVPPGRKG
jgi:hypothetical protein